MYSTQKDEGKMEIMKTSYKIMFLKKFFFSKSCSASLWSRESVLGREVLVHSLKGKGNSSNDFCSVQMYTQSSKDLSAKVTFLKAIT